MDEIFGVIYNFFLEYSDYMIFYEEGYDFVKCFRGKEIMNFYSFCDNFFLMCDIMIRVFGLIIMLIILLMWKLSFFVEMGYFNLYWDVLRLVIDFYIIVKVKLCFFFGNGKKWCMIEFSFELVFGCCVEVNIYRFMWND